PHNFLLFPYTTLFRSKACHLFAAKFLGILKGVSDYLFRAGTRDQLEAFLDLLGLAVLDTCVCVLLVLTDDDDVHDRMLCLHERVDRKSTRLNSSHVSI